MPLTIDDIEALREGWDFEAKTSLGRDQRGELPHDFWTTYSAMANTRGGTVVLGVKQQSDGALVVRGIPEPDRVLKSLWDLLGNRQKVSANILREADVCVERVGDRAVIVVTIPAASRTERPVYLGSNPLTGTWVRAHEGDFCLPPDQVRRMLADADTARPSDSRVLRHHGLDDLDLDTIEQYRNLLSARSPGHAFLRKQGIEFLRALKVWGRDPETGAEGLRRGGLLLFGTEAAITDVYPQFFLDFRRVDPGANRWSDRVAPDGTWTANLLQFYWKVIAKLHADLDVPFSLDEKLVRRAETPVHEALREALVNTLIHADYDARQTIVVQRFADRFEFHNPGTMLVSARDARDGGHSECRNPSLQNAFVLVGQGERAGSGVPRIVDAWRSQSWRAPVFDDDPKKGITTLTLPRVSLLPEGVLAALQRRHPDLGGWTGDERLALVTAEDEGRVSNGRLQELCDTHPRDLTQVLRRLVDRRVLKQHGDRRGAWYTAVEGSSQQSSQQSPHQSSHQSPHQSSGAGPATDEVIQIVAESRWATQQQIRAAILAICTDRYVSAAEIADRLKRARNTISNNYLRPMVKEGMLHTQHAATSHPDQRFRRTEPDR